MSSSKRNALIFALGALVTTYLFYTNDSFWGVLVSLLLFVWALIYMLPTMDALWRFKVGFVTTIFLGACVILIPTGTGMIPEGKATWLTNNWVTRYVKEHIGKDGGFAIAPGLDLKGGIRLVYTVEVDEAIADKRNNFAEEMRSELATIFQVHSGDGRVTREEKAKLEEKVHVSTPETAVIRLRFADPADRSKIDQRFSAKFQQELGRTDGPGPNDVTFKVRTDVETNIRERAVTQAKDTVHRRIDELGLREANVATRDEDIIVEVPGQNQSAFENIKEIIRQTARLEFKMVDDRTDFFDPTKVKEDELPQEGEFAGISIFAEKAPDGLTPENKQKEIITHYVRMALNDNDKDPETGKNSMDRCKKRLKKWIDTKLAFKVPDDHQIGFEEVESPPDANGAVEKEGWRTLYLDRKADVTGDYITDASVNQDQSNGFGGYFVSLTFSPVGGDRFEEVTGANVGRRFAIILDEVVDSAPVIRSKIAGGHAQITMGAGDPEVQLKKAHQLEMVLRAGALPAPISLSSSTEIGASLGEDAIAKGIKGAAVGASLVLVFMIIYYRKAGIVADLAVVFNMIIQMAILASFGATMSLPGIAGLALTIGMAVDANVLINERIREELRAGRSVRAAVEAGYGKAFSSIVDGHVTVFISGLILAQYGSGPVKGFAVTLIVGIIASLFTGVFCTRLVFDWWTRGSKAKTLSVGAEF